MVVAIDRKLLHGAETDLFKLVINGATPEQWGEWLRVPLEHALADGDMDLVTRLIDAGANTSAGWLGCAGRPLIGAAAAGGSKEAVVALLKAGAQKDVDIAFGEGETALQVAAALGAEDAARALLLAGAEATTTDNIGLSHIHVASAGGLNQLVGDLLLRGACPDSKDPDGESPLHLAAKGGHALTISALLISGAEKDSLNENDETPLFVAVCNDHLDAAEELLAFGADLGSDNADTSALEKAAEMGNGDMVEALLRHGALASAVNNDGGTALHVVNGVHVNSNAERIVRALVAAGAEIEACDDFGCTPLHNAASQFTADTARALLASGADIHAKNKTGYTALHTAVEDGSCEVARTLLEAGADPNASDNIKRTPLAIACADLNLEAFELLLRSGADETTAFVGSSEPDDSLVSKLKTFRAGLSILDMLDRAPADRSWRRRRSVVLCRLFPERVLLAKEIDPYSEFGENAEVQRPRSASTSEGDGEGDDCLDDDVVGCNRPHEAISGNDLGSLVGSVVGLGPDAVFRLVVGFL